MDLTAFRSIGKNSSKSFLEVQATTCHLTCSTKHSRFLATMKDAIAGFRLDKEKSHAFLRRESERKPHLLVKEISLSETGPFAGLSTLSSPSWSVVPYGPGTPYVWSSYRLWYILS